ncbi:MAG: T9SS type A sorting domain-containing protein [Bacteroidia bacterium]
MKKFTVIIVLHLLMQVANAQIINGNDLDINNIKARINADGSLFNDYGTSFNQGFEVPKGSGRHTMFAGNLWFGGVDASGILKLGAQTYRQTGTDFFPGPLTITATTDSATMTDFNRVWKINKCDIDTYYNWFSSGQIGPNPTDSVAMNTILTWPAFSPSGLTLAPFVDVNSNGTYEPLAGDHPQIKGDQAIFFVYNDKGGLHTETGGTPIGVEIQGMAYAYSCTDDSALYNTIFTNYKIINRSSFLWDSVFVGNWSDIEIGGGVDDFIACDVTRGAYYGYNGDLIDTPIGTELAYGANPPAQAVVFLKGPHAYANGIDDPAASVPNGTGYGDGIADNERLGMGKFLYYVNDYTVTGNPTVPLEYYNYILGAWKDSSPWTYGGNGYGPGVQCKYLYPATSDPLGYGTSMVPQPNWSEESVGHVPGDRRGLGSYGPFIMQPGTVEDIDFAYVFGRATSGGNLASITVMQERIDSIKQKFVAGITACGCSTSTGINNLTMDNSISIYPNPASENITINFTSSSKNNSLKIYDVTGRLVKNISNVKSGESSINISDLKNGLYLLNLQEGNNYLTKRFVKQ